MSSDEPTIRQRLTVDQQTSTGDTRTSDVHENGFTNTDSRAALHGSGRDENQHGTSSPAELVTDPGGHVGHKVPLTPKEEKAAERKVAGLFLLSVVGVIGFVVTFAVVPQEFGTRGNVYFTPLLGIFMALALGGIGAGAVLWAKLLMVDEESVQERHPFGSEPADRAATGKALKEGLAETQIGRRPLLVSTLALGAGSLAVLPLPFALFLGRFQHKERVLETTAWAKGVRLIRTNGTAVKLGDLQIGGVESVFPDVEGGTKMADAPTLLIRMRPDELRLEGEAQTWAVDGHVAYSSICTHLGCPVKLYEQQTHHLFCPCHQSTFDAAEGCKVLFGPAARALPQLAIAVDDEGYFVAQGDYAEPVGPSYWERKP